MEAVEILVKLPISYIDSDLKPVFLPALADEVKFYGESWKEDLESIHDPADKFAYVSKSRIIPERASEFVKMRISSNTITNATQILFIAENSWGEKTGNVSFFIEMSAFNQNYSRYANQSQNTRS